MFGTIKEDIKNVGKMNNLNAAGYVYCSITDTFLELSLNIQNNIINDVKFRSFGCNDIIATCSMMTEYIKGKSIEHLLVADNSEETIIKTLLNIENECSSIAGKALISALTDYVSENSNI